MTNEVTTTTASVRDFACSCGTENQKRMADLTEWTLQQIRYTSEYREKHPEYQKWVLTVVIAELAARYGAYIVGIPTDPGGWSAIQAKAEAGEWTRESYSTWVECDHIEEGIYLTLQKFAEKFPKGNNKSEEEVDSED
jgi:hypothetical protein